MALNSQSFCLYVLSGELTVMSHHVRPVIFFLKCASSMPAYAKVLFYLDRPPYQGQSARSSFQAVDHQIPIGNKNSQNTWENINSPSSRVIPHKQHHLFWPSYHWDPRREDLERAMAAWTQKISPLADPSSATTPPPPASCFTCKVWHYHGTSALLEPKQRFSQSGPLCAFLNSSCDYLSFNWASKQ